MSDVETATPEAHGGPAGPRLPARWSRARAFFVVVRGDLARKRASTLLLAVVAAVAAAALCSAAQARSATSRSFSVEAAKYHLPDLLVSVPAQAEAATASGLRRTGDFARLGAPFWEWAGVVSAGPRSLEANLLGSGEQLPAWARLVQGVPPGSLPASLPAVYLERGAARALGAHPGSDLTASDWSGTEPVVVAGVVRDMSTESYPYFSSPANVYLDTAAMQALGVLASPYSTALFGAWFASRTTLARAEATVSALPPQGSYVLVGQLTNGSLSSMIAFVVDILAVFSVLALAAMVFLVGGAVRLDVLRRERWVGQLRAMGWTVRGLRLALSLERAPVLVVGAAVGAAAGYFAAPVLVRPLTTVYGAYPAPWHPVLLAVAAGMAVTFVGTTMVAVCTRRLRARSVAAQLAAMGTDRPARWVGAIGRGGAVARFGLAGIAGRKRRSAAVAFVTLLACAVGVFGAFVFGSVEQETHDPGLWGFHYDYRAQVPVSDYLDYFVNHHEGALLGSVQHLGGVGKADLFMSGVAEIDPAAAGPTVPFELVSSTGTVQPPLISGRAATGPDEVEIGTQVAASLHARPGSVLRIGPGWWSGGSSQDTSTVKVAGIVQDIEDNGDVVLGGFALEDDLIWDVTYGGAVGVLVTCKDASVCPQVGPELAALGGSDWSISSAAARTAMPFAASVEYVSVALSAVFALLACAGSLFSGLVTADEMAAAYRLFRAVGARPAQVTASVTLQVGAIAVPALMVGLLVGYPLGHWALSRATASFGGLHAGVPLLPVALSVAVVALASGLGLGLPLGYSAVRSPVRSKGARQ